MAVHWRLVLIVTAVVVAYAVWAYLHPWRPCPRCQGSGRNRGSTARRWGKCWRCKGSREVRTTGARLLHRMVRSARSGWGNWKEK